jgi:putative endonuclease
MLRAMSPVPEGWFVYMARCADGTLYTGTARDVAARIEAHNTGRGARYTRGRGPLVLCAKQRCRSHGDALRLEFAIKRLSRDAKRTLLERRCLAGFARRVFAASS